MFLTKIVHVPYKDGSMESVCDSKLRSSTDYLQSGKGSNKILFSYLEIRTGIDNFF